MKELLAPAGNFEKLKTALYFGADAVYVGGKHFSLRTFADNFTAEELKAAVELSHDLGKKLYVTANIFARNADFGALKDYFAYLQAIGVDAVIVSDAGVLNFVKKVAPKLNVHISTQANTTNKYAVDFWKDQGASRVILARELSIPEISEIHEFVPEIELEAFVHGAMCISYSGRCLLSDYLDGRSSNRGACVQACRWQYEVRALNPNSKEGGFLPVEEDERGTYIFNSKDLNLVAHLTELEKAGVCSFKIEGRMKSEYYLATVVNAYRRALAGESVEECESELASISHRDYTTAYALGENHKTVNYTDGQDKGSHVYIADVMGQKDGKTLVRMRNRFFEGDELEVLSPTENFKKTFRVQGLQTSSGDKVSDAKLVQEIYSLDCPYSLKKGDLLRRKNA